jgi:hypothetical protein
MLEAGSRLLTAVKEMAPRNKRELEDQGVAGAKEYYGPTDGFIEQGYFYELLDKNKEAIAALVNKAGDRAAVIRWDATTLPCFTQWKNTASLLDGYVTGLEPGTDYPNSKPFERSKGRVVKLGPNEKRTFKLKVEMQDTKEGVQRIEQEIAQLQKQGGEAVIHQKPISKYSNV